MNRKANDLFRVLMAPENEQGQADGGTGDGTEEKPTKTFTQEEVNRIATKEARDAERKAQERLSQDLGLPLEEVKKILADRKTAEEGKLTEAEKAVREAAQAKAEAEADRAAAAKERHDARIERFLGQAGVQGDLSKATRLLDVKIGADEAEIGEAVEVLKKEIPGLFAESSPQPKPMGTPSGVGGTKPPASKAQGAPSVDRGKNLFAERHPAKSS